MSRLVLANGLDARAPWTVVHDPCPVDLSLVHGFRAVDFPMTNRPIKPKTRYSRFFASGLQIAGKFFALVYTSRGGY